MPKYWLTLRPDAAPKGYTAFSSSLPACDEQVSAGFTLSVFGWVQYSQPLSFEDCWKFDLLPDDPIEYAHFSFWLFGSRDAKEAAYYEKDYIEAVKNGVITIAGAPEEIQVALEILLYKEENNA